MQRKSCLISLTSGAASAGNIEGQILAVKPSVEKNKQANASEGQSQVSVTLVYGNLYRIQKKKIALGTLNKLKSQVSVAE